jgi:hypothetical protein
MKLAIACGSGGYRTVFIHGVLSAFEAGGLRAETYAGTSASVLAVASAAIGESQSVGVEYWQHGLALKAVVQNGMSDISLTTIAEKSPHLVSKLFAPDAARFFIPASAVQTADGAEQTQHPSARKLGRQLLLSAARRQPHEWVAANLHLHLFDSHASNASPQESYDLRPLTPANFAEVAYASSRMMHAWDIPATIEGQPYVDASYLCSIPAVEVAEQGYEAVIAISADPPGPLYRDIFGGRSVPAQHHGIPIHRIVPQIDPADLGADFTDATPDGLQAAYEQGQQQGRDFLAAWP